MNTRIPLGAAVAFALIVAAVTFSITWVHAGRSFNDKVNSLTERSVNLQKYYEIDQYVRNAYLGGIDETQLMDNVARGYLRGIGDEHGSYIDARSYERTVKRESGDIAGVGMVAVTSPDGYIVVEEVYPESPALFAGIEAGDVIVAIDDTPLTLENNSQQLEAIQGAAGSQISMTVRKGTSEDVFVMTRRQVPVPSVYSETLENNVGYIWIKDFDENTADQFARERRRLSENGIQSMIIDVRDNSGDDSENFAHTFRVLDALVEEGVFATATGKDNSTRILGTFSNSAYYEKPIVVLVNQNTASSAELFAQVLRDYNNAQVVGATTKGIGVLQELFPLSDGSAIRITTEYFTPYLSDNFNGVGVKPDYDISLEEDWRQLPDEQDTQKDKAVEVAIAMQRVGEPEPQPQEPEESRVESRPESEPDRSASEAESSGGEEESSQDDDESSRGDDEEDDDDDQEVEEESSAQSGEESA